jgi:hypothetical protein
MADTWGKLFTLVGFLIDKKSLYQEQTNTWKHYYTYV